MPTIAESTSTRKIDEKLKPMEPHLDPVGTTVPHGGPAPQPTWPSYPRFSVTSLPLSVTYQPDALRQFYRGGVPQQRLIPPQ